MAFLTAMLGLRTRFSKHSLNRKNTISTACLLLCGLSLMGANTSQAEQIYYVHTDHLNTPTLVTDSNKTVVWEGVRKPFGETEEVVATVRQPIRFPGQYFDGETGLAYNLMRDYDSRAGRYVQADPLGVAAGSSLYGYVEQNPITSIDPQGLFGGDVVLGLDPIIFLLVNGYFPDLSQHLNRNSNNQCPCKKSEINSEWKQDSSAWNGGNKFRHPLGYECAYDSEGKLLPDASYANNSNVWPDTEQNYSYNYGSNPLTFWHILFDVYPSWYYQQYPYPSGLTNNGKKCDECENN
ncbi:Hypothetical protein HDN1F_19380 [gamma proteobacterium HdN1]|nr:Hypothetical protein HDN1F_19380 [gamma proteobacterium HdN1]